MNEIVKLFETKLKTNIAGELKARNEFTKQTKQIETDRQSYVEKAQQTTREIEKLEKAIDDQIVSGKSAEDLISKISTKQAEKAAYERQIQRLIDQSIDVAISLKNANTALSEVISAQLEAMRPDVESLVSDHLQNALESLISFEVAAHETEKACDVEINKDRELSVFRFLNLFDSFKSMGAYLEPCGSDMAAIRRRETIELWTARKAEAQREKEKASVKPEILNLSDV